MARKNVCSIAGFEKETYICGMEITCQIRSPGGQDRRRRNLFWGKWNKLPSKWSIRYKLTVNSM